MPNRLPKIERDWHPVKVHISVPTTDTGWITDVEFQTPSGIRIIRFTRSDRYMDVWAVLMGYDEFRITDQNEACSAQREFGRYLVEVFVDGDCSRFEVDDVLDITEE